MKKHRVGLAGVLMAAAVIAAMATSAHAVTRTWNIGNGNWNNRNAWLPVGVPQPADDVVITNNTAQVTLDVDANIRSISVGPPTSSCILNIPAGRILTLTGPTLSQTLGNGTIYLQGGTINANVGFNCAGQLWVFPGTSQINGSFTVKSATPAGLVNLRPDTGPIALTFSNGVTVESGAQINFDNGTENFPISLTVNGGPLINFGLVSLPNTTLNAQLENHGAFHSWGTCAISKASAAHTNSGVNPGTGVYVVSGTLTISQSGTAPSFTNGSTISTFGGDLSINNGTFTNNGTISITANHVVRQDLGGSFIHNGTLNISSTSSLILGDVSLNLNTDLTNASSGSITMTRCIVNGPGVFNNANGTLDMGGCTFNTPFSNSSFLLVMGQAQPTALNSTFTVSGQMTLIGNVNGAAVLNAPSFTNNALTSLTSSSVSADATINCSGTLTNPPGQTIQFDAGAGGARTISAQINNQGSITVNTDATIDTLSADHLNSGAIVVTNGNLTFNQTGATPSFTNTGSIVINSPRTMFVLGGDLNQNSGSIVGGGTLHLTNATFNLGQSFSNRGGLQMAFNGACTVNGPGTLMIDFTGPLLSADIINAPLAIGAAGSVTVIGGNTQFNGTVTLLGELHLLPSSTVADAVLTVANGFTISNLLQLATNTARDSIINVTSGTLINQGLLVATTGSGKCFVNAQLDNRGLFLVQEQDTTLNKLSADHVNAAAGTIEVLTGNLIVTQRGASPSFDNLGTINISPGRLLDVNGGTFTNSGTGVLMGGGSFDSSGTSFVNAGTCSPGAQGATGALLFTGPYVQSSQGRLRAEINGPLPASTYDVLGANGGATLAGRLDVSLGNGYLPIVGTSFVLLTAPSVTGVFELAVMNAAFPDGRYLAVDYAAGLSDGGGMAGGGSVTVTVNVINNVVVFEPEPEEPLPGIPTAGVLGDYDGDLDLDLAITITAGNPNNPGSVIILYNAGTIGNAWQGFSGSSQVAVGANPSGIAKGLFDNNTSFDLAATNKNSNSVTILLNNGAGTFTAQIPAIAVGAHPTAIAAANFNGPQNDSIAPGEYDLVVTSGGTNSFQVLLNQGAAAFSAGPLIPTGNLPVSVDPADVDNDRDVDLVIVNTNSNNVIVHSNNGSAGFPTSIPTTVGANPRDGEAEFINGDSLPDIITANAADGTVTVLLNNPQAPGTFGAPITFAAGANARSLTTADLQVDADFDVAVLVGADGSSAVQILRNDTPANPPDSPPVLNLGEAPMVGNGAVVVLTGDMDGLNGDDLVTVNSGLVSLDDGDGIASVGPNVSVLLNNTGPPCVGDIAPPPHGNGTVNVDDLLFVINHWGPFGGGSAADTVPLGGNGTVNVDDLLAVINHWGACP